MTSLVSIHVAAGVLIRHGRVLVAERPAPKMCAGFWEFPGGKVEEGETPLQALKRELQEEIDVIIDEASSRFLVTLHNSYPSFQANIDVFLVTQWEGAPRPREKQALSYCAQEEMQAPAFKARFLPGLDRVMPHLTPYFDI